MGKKNRVRVKSKNHSLQGKKDPNSSALIQDSGGTVFHGNLEEDATEDSNAIIIHSGKKRPRENSSENLGNEKKNKNLQRKLRRIEEERIAREKREKAFQTLTENKLDDSKLELLHSSGSMGKHETMKEKLRRELKLERAGVALPNDSPVFQKRKGKEEEIHEKEVCEENNNASVFNSEVKHDDSIRVLSNRVKVGNGVHDQIDEPLNDAKNEENNINIDNNGLLSQPNGINDETNKDEEKKKKKRKRKRKMKDEKEEEETKEKNPTLFQTDIVPNSGGMDLDEEEFKKNEKLKEMGNSVHASNTNELSYNKSDVHGDINTRRATYITVVRAKEVDEVREKLPIIMYEQEIMELIHHNPFLIVCGETGSGKTTQIPQFLYEAGYGSDRNSEHSGMIGVTQPRRVAVISTAKRVAHELNSSLGDTVGFQIRHDVQLAKNSTIKFMTDGILLREIQSDFLLTKYSAIILDEAHERSVNTDILIGMCSRIVPLRQQLYEESKKKKNTSSNSIQPLKVIIMSATLRVEDFIENKKLFPLPPPLMHIPSRQYPVTVHFSRRTELKDYSAAVFKKVSAIHRKLPPGGILIFLTGRREVESMCRKLRKSFSRSKSARVLKEQPEERNEGQAEGLEEEDEGGHVAEDLNFQSTMDDNKQDNEFEMNLISKSWNAGDSDLSKFDMGKDEDDCTDDEESKVFEGKDDYDDAEGSGGEGNEGDGEESDLGEDDIWAEDEEDIGSKEKSNNGQEDKNASEIWKNLPSLKSLATKKMEEEHQPGGKNVEEEEKRKEQEEEQKKQEREREREKKMESCSKMFVLPLYAMLPAKEQLRVFSKVPDGFRLVVVATNVAETSLTIPGIRYVVDCGRSKQRTYDKTNGVSRFEISWISKASAEQRCGRAGRTGPGHCYRIYSSAHFDNSFPLFSSPEILNVPIEGVVLQMKMMGIDKVLNFPFPSPPEKSAMKEAEKCLLALSAITPSENRITELGKIMSSIPIDPRHAKTLLSLLASAASTISSKRKINPIILSFCLAAISSLSVEYPFLQDFGYGENDKVVVEKDPKKKEEETQDREGEKTEETQTTEDGKEKKEKENEDEKIQKENQRKRMKHVKQLRSKFMNSQSDALSIANALRAYESTDNQDRFCSDHFLHARTMKEMSMLRKQLLRTVLRFGDEKLSFLGWKSEEDLSRKLLEGEEQWKTLVEEEENGLFKMTLTAEEEKLILQALCAGWIDRVARKILPGEKSEEESAEWAKNRRFVPYLTCFSDEVVFLSPASSVRKLAPNFVVFNELVQVSKTCMNLVSAIDPAWLPHHSPTSCAFSKPLSEPIPWYDDAMDEILCFVSPTFGVHNWTLPLHAVPMKSGRNRTCLFAMHLLKGNVFKSFKSLKGMHSVNPNVLLQSMKAGLAHHPCVVELLAALGEDGTDHAFDSKRRLVDKWIENSEFLLREISLWVQKAHKNKLDEVWKSLMKEVESTSSG